MIKRTEADSIPLSPVESKFPGKYMAYSKTFYCSKGYDMLNVDISRDGEVVARYFADPVTYEFKAHLMGQKWKRIKLDNIIRQADGAEVARSAYSYYGYYGDTRWGWYGDSERVAKNAVGISLEFFENHSEQQRYNRRQQSHWDKIQERLDKIIRRAPDGFEEWARAKVVHPAAVQILERTAENEDIAYQCTECRGTWTRKHKYRMNRKITCPHCGKELTVSKEGQRVNIYLFQKNGASDRSWYERYIIAESEWDVVLEEWDVKLHDQNIAVLEAGQQFGEVFYREGYGYSDISHNGSLPGMRKGIIYPDFDGAEELMSDQQAHCLRYIADKGICLNANKVIIHEEDPGLEYLLKGRFHKLAAERINKEWAQDFDKDAQTIEGYLRLDKQRCDRLRQINGGFAEVEWLRYEKVTGRKVSAQDMKYFREHGISPNDTYRGTRTMLQYITSPTAFRNYLEKQSKLMSLSVQGVIIDYADYIRMARQQGLNLSSEIFYKPKNLKAAHDECVRVAHEKEYETRAQEIEKKFPHVPEILKRIKDKYEFDNGNYAIVMPEKIEDIIAEGRALGHCIDTTDRYFERIQNNVTYLGFLRRSGAKGASWYTLEFEPDGTVRQQRTTGNRQNKEDTESYMPFIREWQRAVKDRIDEEDRMLAEKSKEIRIEEYRKLREDKETVRSGLLAGKLLVDVLEGDLIEAI